MIIYISRFLGKIADLEDKRPILVLSFLFLFTIISLIGITKVEIESDFDKFNPENIPIIELRERIDKQFASFSTIIIIVQLDESLDSQEIDDIRDPEIIEFLQRLNKNLEKEQKIQGVFSAGLFFQEVPEDLEEIKQHLSKIPESDNLFNKAFTLTPVFINADVGADNTKIREINEKILEIIENSGEPGGVKTVITGEPPLGAKIFEFILEDGFFTLIAATITIFLLLLVLNRSFEHALLVIIPVLIGIIWSVGALGWFGIPITVATAALGAMLLGLGTEYSIFLNSRYREERINLKTNQAIKKALMTTGAATVSSGITTMMGFFALTLSIFPVLSDLGQTLGMGIFLVLASTMLISPFLIKSGDFINKIQKKPVRRKERKESKIFVLFEYYGSIVANRPFLVIVIALISTGIVFTGINDIINEEIDFENTLPQDLEELVSFKLLVDEFGDTSSTKIYIELDSSEPNTNEPRDIRDPEIIRYIDVLTQKLEIIEFVESVESISKLERELNDNLIPSSLNEQKELMQKINSGRFITDDFSASVIRIEISEDVFNKEEETVRQIQEIVITTKEPVGIKTTAAGGIVEVHELNKIVNPDSAKTALIAFGMIIVFLLLLTRSIKYTVLPLLTVIFAIIWILGLLGFTGLPFNSIISSVISMTIGIGIDFGIQLSTRYRQELEIHDKRNAMKITLKYTLYPMVITVIAALIGFRAMALGKLTIMADLGNTLSYGVASSMIIAVSLVAGLMVMLERKKVFKQNNK